MDCTCLTCVIACTRCPGELIPSDVPRIARFLMVPVGRFVHESLEETANGALRPKRTADGCVFFVGQRCSIHSVKPFECREWDHTKTGAELVQIQRRIHNAWND